MSRYWIYIFNSFSTSCKHNVFEGVTKDWPARNSFESGSNGKRNQICMIENNYGVF